jgi:hypothetical protein
MEIRRIYCYNPQKLSCTSSQLASVYPTLSMDNESFLLLQPNLIRRHGQLRRNLRIASVI